VEAAASKDHCIPSAWIVRGLAQAGTVYTCRSCNARMFVRYASGLCPLCWNGRGPERTTLMTHVLAERALAGVLDDPAIEAEPTRARACATLAAPA
jgi:hypothetical protein